MEAYMGVDVGSITAKFAALDRSGELIASVYLPTEGEPVDKVQQGLKKIREQLPAGAGISGVACTGSARYLVGAMLGADLVKNEITCHAAGGLHCIPDVQTIIEIGGQDSKIIIIREGAVASFGMNTVCAAGTGSFLDHQAARLNLSIEEFAKKSLASEQPVRITGRCTVFAESDMIHRQQMGHRIEDIAYGLCRALVHNYLSSVGSGKDIRPPIVFQGGVAFNQGMVRAFKEELNNEVIVPPHHELLGAVGAALLVREAMENGSNSSKFRGFNVSEEQYSTSSFECKACSSLCEIAQLSLDDHVLARWGGRCDLWQREQPAATKLI